MLISLLRFTPHSFFVVFCLTNCNHLSSSNSDDLCLLCSLSLPISCTPLFSRVSLVLLVVQCLKTVVLHIFVHIKKSLGCKRVSPILVSMSWLAVEIYVVLLKLYKWISKFEGAKVHRPGLRSHMSTSF